MTSRSIFGPARRAKRILLPVTIVIGLGFSLAGCKTSEEKAEEYYQSGLNFLAEGDEARAIVQFRNVFELEGTHYEARKKLAEVLADQGDLKKAYSQYLRLAEQYPDDLATRTTLARMAFIGRDTEEFQRHTEQAALLSPEDPDVRALQLGLRYQTAAMDDDVAARKDITTQVDELIELRPDDPILLEILLDRAARDKDLEEITPLIDKLIKLQPTNPLRYQQRLAFLIETGRKNEIEPHLLATIKQFPENDEAKADLIRFYVSQNELDKAENYMRERAETASADNPTPETDLILFLRSQRGAEAARAELDRVVKAGGDPLVFRAMQAEFDFADGKRADAIAGVREVLAGIGEASNESRDLQVKLAYMLVEDGDEAGARAQVDDVLTQNKTHPDALKLKAGWAIKSDDPDAAILALRSALDQNPRDVMALGLMADAYERAGERDLTRDYLTQAAKESDYAPVQSLRFAQFLANEGRLRPAEDAILPALEKAPDNPQLLALLGEVYLAMPDLPRAGDVIDRLRGLSGKTSADIADNLELARLRIQDGQGAALNHLEQIAQADNAGLEDKLRLIQARMSAGEFDSAQNLASDLVEEHPDSATAQLALAMATAAGGDMDGARNIMQKLIAMDPKQPAPYLALSVLERSQKGNKAAEDVIEQGLKELPDDVDLLFTKAGLVERQGDIDDAIAIYEQIYRQDTDLIVVANNLASLLATWHGDDPAKLAQASDIARRLKDSQVPAFMETYGWIQHLNGDSQIALPYLEKAAVELTDDSAVQVHLGLVQEAVGQTETAKGVLERAISMESAVENAKLIADAKAALTRMADTANESAAVNEQSNNEMKN